MVANKKKERERETAVLEEETFREGNLDLANQPPEQRSASDHLESTPQTIGSKVQRGWNDHDGRCASMFPTRQDGHDDAEDDISYAWLLTWIVPRGTGSS